MSALLCWYRCPGLFWIRVFGIGIIVKDSRRHPLLFSERNGHYRMLTLRHYVVRYLPRLRI